MSTNLFVEALRASGIDEAMHLADRLDGHEEPFGAVPDGVPHAVIHTPNLVIQEGTKQARIPVTITADEVQTVQLIQLTMGVENIRDNTLAAPLIDQHPDEVFGGSMFNFRSPQDVIRWSVAGRGIVLGGVWRPPFGNIPANGMLFQVLVDTSRLLGGQTYRINTAIGGMSSATMLPPDADPEQLHFSPVHLEHHGGVIDVRAKQ